MRGGPGFGPMLRGDFLWVKWKVLAEDRTCEDTVDLKSRLPRNIEGDVIYFKVDGARLYVYLVLPGRLTGGQTSSGRAKYRYRKALTLYPDEAKKQVDVRGRKSGSVPGLPDAGAD
jgi:hypothetical protein